MHKTILSLNFFLLAVLILIATGTWSATIPVVKEPNVAGSFYPGDKKELQTMISQFLKKVPPAREKDDPWAMIVPHAGYIYSGQTAAYAYSLLRGKQYDTVVVLAPSHFASFDGAAIYAKGSFKTPLGTTPIDEEAVKELLRATPKIKEIPGAFAREHSLEVQLPFLQSVLTGFKLVPIIIGHVSMENSLALKEALVPLLKKKKVLIVASSDMSHYKAAEVNDALDRRAITLLEKNDAEGLLESMGNGDCELCGIGPVLAVALLAQECGSKFILLNHSNSGDTTGDYSAVVGYMAAVYFAPHPLIPSPNSSNKIGRERGNRGGGQDEEFNFTDAEKKALLKIARDSIAAHLESKPLSSTDLGFAKAQRPGAAFVTLHKNGELRGCIGHIRAMKPLADTIQEMARAAAFDDPRFNSLQASELPEIDIEISVLSPMRRISDVQEIVVGKHGLYISQGYNSGLLLPQVAPEQGWDRQEFLEGVCRKAGLPSDAWERGAVLSVFTAEIFHE